MDTDNGHPEYRDCDRREYVFKEYCWTTTETFAKLDKHGYAIKEEDGTYKMVDLGRRICFGDAQNKNRRRGNTSKAISDGIEIITRTIGTDGFGIQSYTEKSAKGHFDGKVVPAWNNLPIWLKPNSISGRKFDTLKLEVNKNDYGEKALNTKIEYATTASSKYFDGRKMTYLLTDEEGKTSICSVSERWGVNKHTLAQGDGMIIRGYSSHPSTVDLISDGAGDYQALMDDSSFYKRIKSKGQTKSGLFRVFIPAQDGLEGFVDSYGYSVTGELKDYQIKEGYKQTAEDYLQGERDLLLQENTPESLMKYREHKQLFPMCYADSWMGDSGAIGFNLQIIDNRLIEIRREDPVIKGRLEWKNGEVGDDVYFVEDEINGHFELNWMPTEDCSNKRMKVMTYNYLEGKNTESWCPIAMKKGVIGADPIKNIRQQEASMARGSGKKDKLSDGGIAGYLRYDPEVDGDVPRSQRKTDRFVMSYRYRPTAEEFNEEVLKAAIFFGFMVYPETNVDNLFVYFIKQGYAGYLIHDVDYLGNIKPKPGRDTSGQSKQALFSLLRSYIDYRGHQEDFEGFLKECKEIRAIEEMRYKDRIAAHGMALAGAESPYVDIFSRVQGVDNDPMDLKDFTIW